MVVCAAFVAMCAFFLIYQRIKPKAGMGLQIAAKCAATSMAALVALLGCLKAGTPASWLLLMGLVACTVADGVLCVRLVEGGAIFVLGHVLYMASFCMMNRPGWQSAAVFLLLMGMGTAGIARFRARLGRMTGLLLAYAAVLSLMVALTAAQRPLVLAGALLFAISDGLLGAMALNRGQRAWLDYASLGMYYLGQFLLGLSVYL